MTAGRPGHPLKRLVSELAPGTIGSYPLDHNYTAVHRGLHTAANRLGFRLRTWTDDGQIHFVRMEK